MADIKRLRQLAVIAACAHEQRAGGNDYIECNDCGLMWDYRREQPVDALRREAITALSAGQEPPQQKAEPEGGE